MAASKRDELTVQLNCTAVSALLEVSTVHTIRYVGGYGHWHFC